MNDLFRGFPAERPVLEPSIWKAGSPLTTLIVTPAKAGT